VKKYSLFLLIILIISLLYRVSALRINHPFWFDEFATGVYAKLLLQENINLIDNPDIYFESNNFLTHSLVAIFFNFFGINETIARVPSLIFGSLVPVIIFFLAKKLFDLKTAVIAAILIAFSYFEIAWSVQARGYVIQQFFSALLFLIYYHIISSKNNKKRNLFSFLLVSILGLLTHKLFILVLAAIFLHFIIFNKKEISKIIKKPAFILIAVSLALYLIKYIVPSVLEGLDFFKFRNNTWYYHAFLWREYGLISFLALIGIIYGLIKKLKETLLFILIISMQLIFVNFFYGHYIAKYTLPIFHYLLMLAGLAIAYISTSLNSLLKKPKFKWLIPLLLTFFIVVNGHKFVIKPKAFYSVNHDMRDIALIDYHQVYQIIQTKGELDKGETAVIDTWWERSRWYLGFNQPYVYTFRWLNEGFRKVTEFRINDQGAKYIPRTGKPPIGLISELADLKLAMEKYPKGFIWIDDASLPADVINYAQNNFKKELDLKQYPLEDNPYVIWSGSLYSWGIE